MDIENAENARWVAVDILKKMEQLEFCMDVLATYIETMEDKMESIQQEFISFTDAAEDLREEVNDLADGLGVTSC